MPIIFAQQHHTHYRWHALIAVVAVAAMAGIALFAFTPRAPRTTALPAPPSNDRQVNMDFSILDSDMVKNLEPFPAVDTRGVQTGRTNPFVIYYQDSQPVKK